VSEQPSNGRGALVWRAVRYGVVLGVGYLAGVSVGGMATESPGLPLLAAAVALALFLAFRQGAKSQAHAAADAIASANVRASAAAVASQTVNVAGGHMVNPAAGHAVNPDALDWDDSPRVIEQRREVSFWDRARSFDTEER
jgi:hypothetical protein